MSQDTDRIINPGRKRKPEYVIDEKGQYLCPCSLCNYEWTSKSSFYRHKKSEPEKFEIAAFQQRQQSTIVSDDITQNPDADTENSGIVLFCLSYQVI